MKAFINVRASSSSTLLLASAVALAAACSSDGGGGAAPGAGGAGTSTGGRGAATGGQRGADTGGAGGGAAGGQQGGGTGGSAGGGGNRPVEGTGGGSGGGTPTTDGPAGAGGGSGSDAPSTPPPATCDYTPKASATSLKLKFEQVTLMGVSTADISKDTGSKDGITEVKFIPGRPNELLLLQKRGKLNHMRLEPDGANRATLVKAFDIQTTTTQDCGLIAMAFDPDFANNKLIYVGFCTGTNASKLVRYKFDADALTDPVDIMTWSGSGGPAYHSIGAMGFDPQGVMWILHGEFYTGANAQNLNNNLGKLLRLIPSRTPGMGGYMPAADNPFAMDAKPRSTIYAWGFRSPWRGVRTAKGHWVVGDVQDQQNEELNVVTAKGQNFGWPASSGACSGSCTTPATYYRGARDPYDGQGNQVKEARQGRAIWVGTQYGDCGKDRYQGALTGVILFGDFYAGWVRGLVLDDAGKLTKDVLMGELGTVSSMDQHADGHLYATTLGPYGTAAGERAGLWRVVPQ